eukprot:CAMPEP_0177497492 /NCGR_PEP_ID=MMETSP0369-20130122/35075_1 /TAXON_ID=447022 ORGANISM="Scrippsiella hangoei-like, Strain SHHI-4" /NCGR_SAMPLE_ID=MMETSP0369 /ASSEMBLY_ACC=CAM_ASM_000364 /LENGTH=56 /DNA_ID=CAMNT_0018974645 /DNA_START=149 /DNA_END=319 /DNA_ORIENTATION=+
MQEAPCAPHPQKEVKKGQSSSLPPEALMSGNVFSNFSNRFLSAKSSSHGFGIPSMP